MVAFAGLHCLLKKVMVADEMNVGLQHQMKKPKTRVRVLGLVVLAFCWVLAVPVFGVTLEVDAAWGFGDPNADLGAFHLQVGSIVQIIVYDSSLSGPPGPDANDNFDVFGVNPNGVLLDNNVYSPYTSPEGHVIVGSGTIELGAYGDGTGTDWWNFTSVVTIDGPYDHVYIRVFEVTDFPQGEVVLSYWGLSDVVHFDPTPGYVSLPFIDDTVANQQNYFEVIPEPGVSSLLVLGGLGLGAVRRRRHRR